MVRANSNRLSGQTETSVLSVELRGPTILNFRLRDFGLAKSDFGRRLTVPRRTSIWSDLFRMAAQPIEASLAKPDLYAPTSVSISASVIGVENVHVPELMMMQPSL